MDLEDKTMMNGGSGPALLAQRDPPPVQSPSSVMQKSGDALMPFAYQPPAAHVAETAYKLSAAHAPEAQVRAHAAPVTVAQPQAASPNIQPLPIPRPASQEDNTTLRALVVLVAGAALLAIGFMLAAMLTSRLGMNTGLVVQPGEPVTETYSVPLGAAQMARVFLDMDAGNITVSGGANNLMDGTATYNISQWKPAVDYSVAGSTGTLAVRQPKTNFTVTGNARNTWDLRLNADVPTDLTVSLGAGNASLMLGDMAISKLDVENHAGNTTIDLSGHWTRNLNARIAGDTGNIILQLPTDVGVRVTTRTGVGQVIAKGLAAAGNV